MYKNKWFYFPVSFFIVLFLIASNTIQALAATTGVTYYVSTNGNDANPGTLSQPLKTIQKCLDRVLPGGTCEIMAGTYYESLILRTSGTENARITIRNYNGQTVTVNSGSGKTLVTGGRIHYYTIDGLRFIASYTSPGQGDYTIKFSANIWDGEANRDGGNNGFILRNCYVEGSIQFYGHNNLVENCELNGKNNWVNGLVDNFAASHDNIYRNNVIHEYKNRGIWTMQNTDNILIEANLIYNTGGRGIDCDGAWIPINQCKIIGNIIHDITGEGIGIHLENSFNSLADGNIIYNLNKGVHAINYGLGPGFMSSAEYRTTNTNTIIRNNIVYKINSAGILCQGSPGGKALNNTIYQSAQLNYWGGIALAQHDGYFCHNWEIKNNIISQSPRAALWIDTPPTGLTNFSSNYNLFDFKSSDTKLEWVVSNGTTSTVTRYTLSQIQSAKQLELRSKIGDTLFLDQASYDFHLQSNSPAIDMGYDLGSLNPHDFEGFPRPSGTGYDIGAFEGELDLSKFTPVLIAPNETEITSTPTFIWNTSSRAQYYKLAVYSYPTAAYVILDTVSLSYCNTGQCAYPSPISLPNGDYKFKVLAYYPAGVTPYSDWMWFAVDSIVLPFAPLAPSGTVNGVSKPNFEWTTYPGATSYKLAMYLPAAASYLILDIVPPSYCNAIQCLYPSPVDLSNGSYKFKVLAYIPGGATPYTDWMDFTITGVSVPPPSYPPVPISPSGTVTTHRPTLKWGAVEYATFYRLAVYSYATASYVFVANVYPSCVAGVCSYTPNVDLVNGDYKFKLLARNSSGYTAYGDFMGFTVSSNLPLAPTLLAPSGTLGSNPPEFQWVAVSDATSYRLAVYSYQTGNYVILTTVYPSACGSDVCSYIPPSALASGDYKFKMLTYNNNGSSDYSQFMSFTVP